jgi:uncharacterized membrane protein
MYNSYEGPTTLGIAERWERVLCYALGWLSGIVLLIVEQRNHTVRRHAAQSMIVFGTLSILAWIVSLLHSLFGAIPFLGFFFGLGFGLLGWAIGALIVVLWLVLMVMAYSRPNFFLPLGRTYERLLG